MQQLYLDFFYNHECILTGDLEYSVKAVYIIQEIKTNISRLLSRLFVHFIFEHPAGGWTEEDGKLENMEIKTLLILLLFCKLAE